MLSQQYSLIKQQSPKNPGRVWMNQSHRLCKLSSEIVNVSGGLVWERQIQTDSDSVCIQTDWSSRISVNFLAFNEPFTRANSTCVNRQYLLSGLNLDLSHAIMNFNCNKNSSALRKTPLITSDSVQWPEKEVGKSRNTLQCCARFRELMINRKADLSLRSL